MIKDPSTSRPAWPKLVIVLVFLTALAAFVLSGGVRFLSLDVVKTNAAALRGFSEANYLAALTIAFAVCATAASLGLPTGAVLSLTFGFLFGRWAATALVVAAATIGATILFLMARYLFGEVVRRKLGKFGAQVNAEFTHDGFSWLLFMRLMPVFPYFLVSLVPALTQMRARTFMAASAIGVLPSTLIVTNLGQALGSLESTRDLLTPDMLIALSLLALLALIPVLLRHLRSRKR